MADDLTYKIKGLITEFTCGFCNSQAGYEIEFAKDSTWHDNEIGFLDGCVIAVLKCRNCGMLNTFIFKLIKDDYEEPFSGDINLYVIENPNILDPGYDEFEHRINPTWIEIIGQYPYGHKISHTVPDAWRQDLREAGNCLAVNAPNAAVIMCRRVVQRLATYLLTEPSKCNSQKLSTALKQLKKEGNVDEIALKALDEIREWGNSSAHPSDDETEINLQEAQKIVEFVSYIVDCVFPKRDSDKMLEELERTRKNRKDI
jgi:Domain of unknown function (DUF4145)